MVGNITSCNNLRFCDDELPDEGRNHNLALHISINYKNDSFSNVLINNGPALNVIPRSTLMKLKYQGSPLHPNGMIVKAFDGSRKSIIGEVGSTYSHRPRLVSDYFPSHGYYARLQLSIGTTMDT